MISYFTNKNNNIQQKLQPGDIFITQYINNTMRLHSQKHPTQ